MNLDQWLEKILALHPVAWDLGLERVGDVGRRLDLLKPAQLVFLVAGTNGKGSTCEMLAQLCKVKGLTYGKTTSPYLLRYNEQFVINGEEVKDQTIINAFQKIEDARGDISLTYFEFSALAALYIFKQEKLDVAILEIGLGGRLDAMNIVDADVSIITRIAVDHVEWLGSNREDIAREKAGVFRLGKPCIIVDSDPPESLFEEAVSQQVDAKFLGRDFSFLHNKLTVENLEFYIPPGKLPTSSILAAISAMVIGQQNLSQADVLDAVLGAELPGRYQKIPLESDQGQDLIAILDVAHNPNAAEYLLELLKAEGIDHVQAIVGMYRDKDVDQVFNILSPIVKDWHFPALENERALSPENLSAHLHGCCGLESLSYDTVSAAYNGALYLLETELEAKCSEEIRTTESSLECPLERPLKKKGVILVFGSFSIVAAMLLQLNLEK